VLATLPFDDSPSLGGSVLTRPKPNGELVLVDPRNRPVLAWCHPGLGMTAVFTPGVNADWTGDFEAWDYYGPFWANVVRHIMRKDARGLSLQVRRTGRQVVLTADVTDPEGQFVNKADLEVLLFAPGGKPARRLPVSQSGPGRYKTTFETAVDADRKAPDNWYYLQVVQKGADGQPLQREGAGVAMNYPDELRLRPTNDALLRSVAELTGGTYSPAPADVFAPPGRPAHQPMPLWPTLVTAALLLFVADVALRRIDLGVVWSRARFKLSAWRTRRGRTN
jgi:hypothetical protein